MNTGIKHAEGGVPTEKPNMDSLLVIITTKRICATFPYDPEAGSASITVWFELVCRDWCFGEYNRFRKRLPLPKPLGSAAIDAKISRRYSCMGRKYGR